MRDALREEPPAPPQWHWLPADLQAGTQLFDLAEDLFALRSEEHALKLLHQQCQTFDLTRPRGERRGVLLMLCLEVILILIVLSKDHRLQRCRIEGIQIRQAEG